MNNTKCTQCGTINFAAPYSCRRCRAVLPLPTPVPVETPVASQSGRGVGQSLLWIAAVTTSLLVASYASLIITSTGLAEDEKAMTRSAIAVLERTQLGWTSERYGDTRVWKNTREWTMNSQPALFQCGVDGRSDCIQ